MRPSRIEELATGPEIIICRDVHKWYGGYHAVRGVTTTIMRGQVVVIIGPSGSGKSTFIRAINNLEQHQREDIIVDGILLNQDTRNIDAVRRSIGMVSQNVDLFPHLSVLQNVTLAPINVNRMKPGDAEDTAMELLERVGMPDQANKLPNQLSGGQRQKVAIARAMAMKSNIMLLDEPTSELDVETVGDIVNVMRELARSEMTTIAVTHEMGFAREAADRVILFDEGQIVEDQPPREFFNNPKHPRTHRFLERAIERRAMPAWAWKQSPDNQRTNGASPAPEPQPKGTPSAPDGGRRLTYR